MAQTHEGALKVCAKKAGCSLRAYRARRACGDKWCMNCKKWHPVSEFGKDRTRYDGYVPSCRKSRNIRVKRRYQPKPRTAMAKGRRFKVPRNGDKLQARGRVNYLVKIGLLPKPGDLPCADCGHIGAGHRHEYDHCKGYEAKHHETVEVVCSKCHRARQPNHLNRKRNGGGTFKKGAANCGTGN